MKDFLHMCAISAHLAAIEDHKAFTELAISSYTDEEESQGDKCSTWHS